MVHFESSRYYDGEYNHWFHVFHWRCNDERKIENTRLIETYSIIVFQTLNSTPVLSKYESHPQVGANKRKNVSSLSAQTCHPSQVLCSISFQENKDETGFNPMIVSIVSCCVISSLSKEQKLRLKPLLSIYFPLKNEFERDSFLDSTEPPPLSLPETILIIILSFSNFESRIPLSSLSSRETNHDLIFRKY